MPSYTQQEMKIWHDLVQVLRAMEKELSTLLAKIDRPLAQDVTPADLKL